MRMQTCSLLAALCFAIPAVAQETGGQKPQQATSKTEKLWKIECSGISG